MSNPFEINCLKVENLEGRELLTSLILLDFDGQTASERWETTTELHTSSEMANQQLEITGTTTEVQRLNQEYAKFSYLDVNSDGILNDLDSDQIAEMIVAKVQQDFSPYDVIVKRVDDHDTAMRMMRENPAGDTLLSVGVNERGGFGGQAGNDIGNTRDTFGGLGGLEGLHPYINDPDDRTSLLDRCTTMMANLASHEAGHTFGLEHVVAGMQEAGTPNLNDRNIMDRILVDLEDSRGYIMNVNQAFWDIDLIDSDGAVHNQHEYLTEVLGSNSGPWAAVLQPGILTVNGGANGFQIKVDAARGLGYVTSDAFPGTSYRENVEVKFTGSDLVERVFSHINSFASSVSETHIRGLGGNDLILVGHERPLKAVAHSVFGGSGDDRISVRTDGLGNAFSADGGAYINGQSGNDAISGSSGSDRLYGGTGNDVISAGRGHDFLDGGSGEDRLFGRSGRDRIFGAHGNDYLSGASGEDYLHGGHGDDRILGGGERDRITGAQGHDVVHGGEGNDTIRGGDGNDRLYGNSGNDVIFGQNGDDFIKGDAGNDLLFGNQGNDFLSGGTGEDRLIGHQGEDRLFGDEGEDQLFGGEQDDVLSGGSAGDRLDGGEGDDRLYGNGGADYLLGREGNDLFFAGRLDRAVDRIFASRGESISELGILDRVFYED